VKTAHLIDMLARQSGAAPRWVVESRLGVALVFGVAASAVAVVCTLGLNPRLLDMGSALGSKLAYVVGVMAGALWLTDRLARPGVRLGNATASLALVVFAMCVLASAAVLKAPGEQRLELFLGHSWASCPYWVAAMSVPAFLAAVWALRGLAPTRPRLAGFAAGLVAGSLGALGYALHCPEVSPMFVLIWYSFGILVPAAIGGALGPWLLRW